MSQILGASWYKQFGDVGGEAFETWCSVVQDLSPEQIAQGFKKFCMAAEDNFLDAKKFRRFCVGEEKIPDGATWDATAGAWRRPELLAENLLCDKTHAERRQVAIDQVARLRRSLGGIKR